MKKSYDILRDQLFDCILSCPIVYVNHHHYSLIDKVLLDIISLPNTNLQNDCVIEFDKGQGAIVKFETKQIDSEITKQPVSIKELLKYVVDPTLKFKNKSLNGDDRPWNDHKRIFLFKNLSSDLFGENEIPLLQTFVSKYESDEYDPLTTIIIVSPDPIQYLPITIKNHITIVEVLPPTAEEIEEYIAKRIGAESFTNPRSKRDIDEMVRTLQGLQLSEVQQTLRTALALNRRINKGAIRTALKEKQRIVKKSGIIEVVNADVSFNDIGGLRILRKDLEVKSKIYENLGDAEKYHIPIPKGVLIIGMPGCGKSMIAKATANKFGVPLLRLDVSRLMGKYVGESEGNLRLALATAEAAHPCILWIDEIEKAFAGTNNRGGDNDMLVMRMMGYFLTWMQERKTPVFIVATANDVMRPEFMRKGRFDEVYFVNFPEPDERAEILKTKIESRYPTSANNKLFDFSSLGNYMGVVKNMSGKYGGFSGAEIECVLNMVVEDKFQEYLNWKQSNINSEEKPPLIRIVSADFERAISEIKDSVMANQEGKKCTRDEMLKDKTSIERIIDMNNIYNFRNASK